MNAAEWPALRKLRCKALKGAPTRAAIKGHPVFATSGVTGGYARLIDGGKISTSRSCIAAAIHSRASAKS